MNWTFASKKDIQEMHSLLSAREWECIGLTSRLSQEGKFRLPSPSKAKVALGREKDTLKQIVYISQGGFIIPYLPGSQPSASDPALKDIFFTECEAPHMLVGIANYVENFSTWIQAKPSLSIDYHLMKKERHFPTPKRENIAGLKVRRATAADLETLLPLQEAYEKEEILVRPDYFNPGKTRAELKVNLKNQLVYLADYSGKVIAKAGTNAQGFTYDQIGGVFTIPGFRGRKFARTLMHRLLGNIFENGKRACLFVKKSNLPAQRLYINLGFRIAESYRISYFKV
ncbi:MAG: GNAT family N-acetyltransferase [Spirochaetales bacterium]|nr:GNAT family N-acetyltransferase [Spirochaetales bacterium]